MVAVTSIPAGLMEIEAEIERCLNSVVRLGQLLDEVKKRKLYEGTYANFDAYCREKWGIGRCRAKQLIDAADVAAFLVTIGNHSTAENERVYRRIGKIPREELLLVWQKGMSDTEDEEEAGDRVAAFIEQRLAGMSDEQQAGLVQAHESQVRQSAPAGGPNWLRKLTSTEKWAVRFEREHGDIIADLGRSRHEQFLEYLHDLTAALKRRSN